MKKIILIFALFCSANIFAQKTIKVLLPDSVTQTKTIHVGTDSITGLEIYRRMTSLYSDVILKQHHIGYEEWLVAKDGNIYDEFYTIKYYIVVDNLDTKNFQYTNWFKMLAPALLPDISKTLMEIPKNSPTNYVTTK